jgi:hypothetical protein
MAEWACQRCRAQNREDAADCYFCGAERPTAVAGSAASPSDPGAVPASWPAGAEWTATGGPSAGPAGTDWRAAGGPAAAPALAIGPGGFVGGSLFGIVAAVLATVIWYLVIAVSGYQIGFVAVAVGWLIGTAIVLGARGRMSWGLIGLSVVLTLIALVVSEYLIVYHFFTEFGRSELGLTETIPLIQALDVMLEFVLASVEADPLTLLFWGLALVAAAVIPFRSLRPST